MINQLEGLEMNLELCIVLHSFSFRIKQQCKIRIVEDFDAFFYCGL